MASKMGRFVFGVYAAVILIITGALLQVALVSFDRQDVAQPVEVKEDPEITAIIDDLTKAQEIPLDELDRHLPLRSEPEWRRQAAPQIQTDGPVLALVIDDLGLNARATEQIANIGGPFTLAYLPYANALPAQTARARAAGHELLVHLPMEPKISGVDPGPNALFEGLDMAEFDRRLVANLSQFEGFVGVNNHMGSLLTENPGRMVRIMAHLKGPGLMWLDSLTSPSTVGPSAARAGGVPYLVRDIFLDNDRDEALIRRQLGKALQIAVDRGYAIAIGHPYPETLAVLETLENDLAAKGVALVPLSQIMAMKAEQTAQMATKAPGIAALAD